METRSNFELYRDDVVITSGTGEDSFIKFELFPNMIFFDARLKNYKTNVFSGRNVILLAHIEEGEVVVSNQVFKKGDLIISTSPDIDGIQSSSAICYGVILPLVLVNHKNWQNKVVSSAVIDDKEYGDLLFGMLRRIKKDVGLWKFRERYEISLYIKEIIAKVFSVVSRDGVYEKSCYQKLKNYFLNNAFSDWVGVDRVVSDLHMSRAKVYRLSQKNGGVVEIVNGIRLHAAYIDIISGRVDSINASDIYRIYGFKSNGSFVRCFNKRYKVTPFSLRKNKFDYMDRDFSIDSGESKITIWMKIFFPVLV